MMEFKTDSISYKYIYPLLFIIPMNIFIIGNNLGQGIQWAFFRYQNIYFGPSFIPITRNIDYIINGTITGRSAIAELLIIIAAIGFIVAFLLLLTKYAHAIKISGIITLIIGLLLLISSFVQYGITLHGPAGESIPVGVPLLFILGALMTLDRPLQQQKSGAFEVLKKYDYLLFFIGCLLVYYIHITVTSFSNDTITNQLLPYYILHDHTLYLDQAMPYINNSSYAFRFVETGSGHFVSLFPIVTPVLVLPLYVLPITILNIPMTDYSLLFMGKLSATIISALACVFIFLTCKRIATYKIALISALIFAFATSTWSLSSQIFWAHCTVELLLACALYLVVRNEEADSVFNIAGLGIITGLFVFNRPSDAVLIAPVIVYVLKFCYEKFSIFAAMAFISGSPFLIYNLFFFGNPIGGYAPIAERLGFSATTVINFTGLLIAPNKGLLVFSPILVLALIGFYALWKKKEIPLNYVLICSIPAILINLVIYALFDDWIGGVVFGPRYLTGILPFLAISVCFALSYLFETDLLSGWKRTSIKIAVVTLLLISVLVQITGIFYYPVAMNSGLMSSEDDNPWSFEHSIIIDSLVYGSSTSNLIYFKPEISNESSLSGKGVKNKPGTVLL